VSDEDQEHSARQPIGGPERRQLPALLAVLAMVVVLAAVFALVTWLQHTT
jgi:hypothetical protein